MLGKFLKSKAKSEYRSVFAEFRESCQAECPGLEFQKTSQCDSVWKALLGVEAWLSIGEYFFVYEKMVVKAEPTIEG